MHNTIQSHMESVTLLHTCGDSLTNRKLSISAVAFSFQYSKSINLELWRWLFVEKNEYSTIRLLLAQGVGKHLFPPWQICLSLNQPKTELFLYIRICTGYYRWTKSEKCVLQVKIVQIFSLCGSLNMFSSRNHLSADFTNVMKHSRFCKGQLPGNVFDSIAKRVMRRQRRSNNHLWRNYWHLVGYNFRILAYF